MEKTMVQLKKTTVQKLQQLKRFERETYDDVINSLIVESDGEVLDNAEIKEIEEGIADIKSGKVSRIEDVAKEIGVKL